MKKNPTRRRTHTKKKERTSSIENAEQLVLLPPGLSPSSLVPLGWGIPAAEAAAKDSGRTRRESPSAVRWKKKEERVPCALLRRDPSLGAPPETEGVPHSIHSAPEYVRRLQRSSSSVRKKSGTLTSSHPSLLLFFVCQCQRRRATKSF